MISSVRILYQSCIHSVLSQVRLNNCGSFIYGYNVGCSCNQNETELAYLIGLAYHWLAYTTTIEEMLL